MSGAFDFNVRVVSPTVKLKRLEEGDSYKLKEKVITKDSAELPQILLDHLYNEYHVLDEYEEDMNGNITLTFLLNPDEQGLRVPTYIAEEEVLPHAAPLETEVDRIVVDSLWLPKGRNTLFLQQVEQVAPSNQGASGKGEGANQQGGKRKKTRRMKRKQKKPRRLTRRR